MAEDFTGQTIGTYRVEECIGAGGMGEVYRAYDLKLDRPVAIKLLHPKAGVDPDRLQRFRAEARTVSALNHPHILIIYDIGEEAGRPFMVTEFVDGVTLRQRMAQAPLPVRETIAIATQVASALAAAHSRGIVHRDIKLDNIMLRSDGYNPGSSWERPSPCRLNRPQGAESIFDPTNFRSALCFMSSSPE